ncbi:hypothetical protein KJ611_03525 [Patescibacteria group bacterium]|nr:hypothetical protein [Patescibacteria group bacterium]MBU1705437.1 hypothetical protein [Patescibacteria group bacterium]
MDNPASKKWYEELIQSINRLAEQFGLDDISTSHLRDFIVGVAREQYKVGNKSGARWAFKKMEAEGAAPAA